jgi:hypothetical protein
VLAATEWKFPDLRIKNFSTVLLFVRFFFLAIKPPNNKKIKLHAHVRLRLPSRAAIPSGKEVQTPESIEILTVANLVMNY